MESRKAKDALVKKSLTDESGPHVCYGHLGIVPDKHGKLCVVTIGKLGYDFMPLLSEHATCSALHRRATKGT